MTVAEHWVATTRGGDRSLTWAGRGRWLWERLRAALPEALSCVLMPDHVHLVLPPGCEQRLRRVLLGFTVRFGVRFDVLPAEPANSVAIAGRMMRYGFFNPPRAELVDDPWAWPWSSLRDLVGATVPVWTPLSRIAATLRLSKAATLRKLTKLGDASPPLPRPHPVAATGFDAVRDAVASALRLDDPADLTKTTPRRLIVQTLYEIGAPRPGDLAALLGCSERSLRRDRSCRHAGLDAVLLCLGDPRLRTNALAPRSPTATPLSSQAAPR